jgi:hypothetical protein
VNKDIIAHRRYGDHVGLSWRLQEELRKRTMKGDIHIRRCLSSLLPLPIILCFPLLCGAWEEKLYLGIEE